MRMKLTRHNLVYRAAIVGGALALGGCMQLRDQTVETRPNILWLTTEDSCDYEFGPYGNRDAKMPNIDSLARRGVTFTHACSTGTQCSPARSSIITGAYATTYGMDYHRGKVTVPDGIFFPKLLSAAGYFCTNARKTDYNAITAVDGDCWDECDGKDGMEPDQPQVVGKATYENPERGSEQPFFSVFNYFGTHMRYVRTCRMQPRKHEPGKGPDPARVNLPPHVPDLPEVRSDHARHLERIEGLDVWVGEHLKNIERLGLQDDTIVFFFADNGGCLPRGKGFVFDTGHHVPMIVYVPPKWRRLLDLPAGSTCERLVSFVDLAPTVLSLAGVAMPERMQGHAFMGQNRTAPPALQFGFTTNSGDTYTPTRSVFDGRFKLLHSYIPHKPESLRNFFQWGMPANLAWDNYVLNGECRKEEWLAPFKPHSAERLFDTLSDPFELHDLADDPQYEHVRFRLRQGLSAHLRATGDLGFFPVTMRDKSPQSLYDWVRESNFPLNDLITAAETAGAGDPKDRAVLIEHLTGDRPEFRFWGASGLATLAQQDKGGDFPPELLGAMSDPDPCIASAAALAVCYYGKADQGVSALMTLFEREAKAFAALQETLSASRQRVPYGQKGWPPAYSALETLSLDPRFVPALRNMIPRLQAMHKGYKPDKRRNCQQNARSILINLGTIPVADLYTQNKE